MATLFRVFSLVVGALSLAPSFAHVLEAPPRVADWPPELWRETTVFHGQYALFGLIGGPVDMLAVVLTVICAVLAFRRDDGAAPAITAALLFAGALAVWLSVVQPANGVMATWRPGTRLAPSFERIRNQWEAGHVVIAGLKLAGFAALAWWAARPRPSSDA
jgi:hypothetical protein